MIHYFEDTNIVIRESSEEESIEEVEEVEEETVVESEAGLNDFSDSNDALELQELTE